MSVNSMDPYKAREDKTEKMLLKKLKPSHITVTYVTVKLTEVTRVTRNMCHVNILIKKNVAMCLHLKLILMDIM